MGGNTTGIANRPRDPLAADSSNTRPGLNGPVLSNPRFEPQGQANQKTKPARGGLCLSVPRRSTPARGPSSIAARSRATSSFSRILATAGGNRLDILPQAVQPVFLGYPIELTRVMPAGSATDYTAKVMLLFGNLNFANDGRPPRSQGSDGRIPLSRARPARAHVHGAVRYREPFVR